MEKEYSKEKKILTANQMIGELLMRIVVYGGISYIIYRVLYAILVNMLEKDKNFVLLGIIVIGLQALIVFITFKLANRKVFKENTIHKEDVRKVITNVYFVIVAILVIQVLGTFVNVNDTVDEFVNEDYSIRFTEAMISRIYDEEQMQKYHIEKEKAIQDVKNQLYEYLTIVEIGIVVIYVLAMLLEKKYIYSKAQ